MIRMTELKPTDGATPPAKKRRLGKRTVKLLAWGAGVLGFALPWAAFDVVPGHLGSAAQQQVVVVPAGSKVVITKAPSGGAPGVVVVSAKSSTPKPSAPAVATTRASAPPPKI